MTRFICLSFNISNFVKQKSTMQNDKQRPAEKRTGGLLIPLILLLLLVIVSRCDQVLIHESSTPSQQNPTSPSRASISVPRFLLLGLRDASFAACIRLIADVLILEPGALTDKQLIEIARSVVKKIIATKRVNAIGVFFWYKASNVGKTIAKASVDWAPYGQWDKACTRPPGDYSRHSFRVDFNRTS